MSKTDPQHGAAVIFSSLWECKEFKAEKNNVRLVIIFVVGYANKESNRIIPFGSKTIARLLKVDHKTVARAISICVKQGWVEICKRKICITKEWQKKWDGRRTGKGLYTAIYPADIWSDEKLLRMPSQRKYGWIWILCHAQYNWARHGRTMEDESTMWAFVSLSARSASELVGISRAQVPILMSEVSRNGWVDRRANVLLLPQGKLIEWGSHSAIRRKAKKAKTPEKTPEETDNIEESVRGPNEPLSATSGAKRATSGAKRATLGGQTSHFGGQTSHFGGQTSHSGLDSSTIPNGKVALDLDGTKKDLDLTTNGVHGADSNDPTGADFFSPKNNSNRTNPFSGLGKQFQTMLDSDRKAEREIADKKRAEIESKYEASKTGDAE